jgi:hypothetical protein
MYRCVGCGDSSKGEGRGRWSTRGCASVCEYEQGRQGAWYCWRPVHKQAWESELKREKGWSRDGGGGGGVDEVGGLEVGTEVPVLVVATGSAWLTEVGVGASGRSARVGTGGRVEVR